MSAEITAICEFKFNNDAKDEKEEESGCLKPAEFDSTRYSKCLSELQDLLTKTTTISQHSCLTAPSAFEMSLKLQDEENEKTSINASSFSSFSLFDNSSSSSSSAVSLLSGLNNNNNNNETDNLIINKTKEL